MGSGTGGEALEPREGYTHAHTHTRLLRLLGGCQCSGLKQTFLKRIGAHFPPQAAEKGEGGSESLLVGKFLGGGWSLGGGEPEQGVSCPAAHCFLLGS